MPTLCEMADALDARWRGGEPVEAELRALLDQLQRTDHGLTWRYVPGGRFEMGSATGQLDERPAHPVVLRGFWMTDVPISWAAYCRLMGWEAPPVGLPEVPPDQRRSLGSLANDNKIRLQYDEGRTRRANDWHAHAPNQTWTSQGRQVSAQQLFGEPEREAGPWTYDEKPMVAVSWHMACDLASRLSRPGQPVSLPTEAQWERAARGGLSGQPYPWGSDPPTEARCDFDAFEQFRVLPSRTFPPNGYGLYAMCGGVWEWCRDHYSPDFYSRAPVEEPCQEGEATAGPFVMRGGSWADCAEVVTTSFRAARRSLPWWSSFDEWCPATPNTGFRLVMTGEGEPQVTLARPAEAGGAAGGDLLAYTERGSGPPLLCLHGLLMSGAALAPLVQALARHHRVIVPDLRGHGASRRWPPPFTVEQMALDLPRLLDHLGLRTVTVVGCLEGVAVAHQLALDHPERVAGLILVGTSALSATSAPERWLTHLLPVLVRVLGWARIAWLYVAWRLGLGRTSAGEALTAAVAEQDADRAIEAWRAVRTANPPSRWEDLQCPRLVIMGSGDSQPSSASSRALLDEGAGAKVVVLDGGDRALPWTHAEAVAEAARGLEQGPAS